MDEDIDKKIMLCKLKEYMDMKGLNIAQLSRETGVTENAIRGYAKNSFTRIDCQTAIKLCTYFDAQMGEMFVIKKISNTQTNI
jgi:putative transcriptional regulator